MKKQLLLAAALFGMFFTAQAQEATENFETGYTAGDLATDLTGATTGQNGWAVQAGTTFAASDFQIVADASNVLEVNGPTTATGAAYLWKSSMLDWEGRTAGNNAVSVTYDFYTGTMDATAGNAFGGLIFNDDYSLLLNGFVYDQRTLSALGYAYVMLQGDTEPDNQLITLGNAEGTAAAVLPENTWITVTMTYDQATGQISWLGEDPDGAVVFTGGGFGSAPEATPFEFDFTTQNVYANNATSSSTMFDNLSVELVGSTAGVNENTLANLSVYPNPANNVVNVSVDALVSNIAIVDLNGRTVKSVKFDGVSNASVNVSDLASGVYMMNVSSDKGTTTKKIVKN